MNITCENCGTSIDITTNECCPVCKNSFANNKIYKDIITRNENFIVDNNIIKKTTKTKVFNLSNASLNGNNPDIMKIIENEDNIDDVIEEIKKKYPNVKIKRTINKVPVTHDSNNNFYKYGFFILAVILIIISFIYMLKFI